MEHLRLQNFGRFYYSFCLSPSASMMHTTDLDFGIVVFPLVLILITNFLVKLYDCGYKPIMWLVMCLKPLRHRLKLSSSLVPVFASFLNLSSYRLFITSINLLIPVTVYEYQQGADGNMHLSTKYCVLSEPDLVYFSRKHMPYALLALSMLLLFFIVSMVLLFAYPFSWFQRLLYETGLNSLVLITFMDVFQRYKWHWRLSLFLRISCIIKVHTPHSHRTTAAQ